MTTPGKQLRRLRLNVDLRRLHSREQEGELLKKELARLCRLSPGQIGPYTLVKKSLDARDKQKLSFVYTVEAELPTRCRMGETVQQRPPLSWPMCELPADQKRPLVVGAGPAGLFAAWALAKAGLRPLVIEQGRDVERRSADVEIFWRHNRLDPTSNIQFGEGGAGAFSDGKLTSRSKDPLGREVLRLLIECGADPSIAYWYRPHLGSDKLPGIIADLREKIIALGGEFAFETALTDLEISAGRLRAVTLQGPTGIAQVETDDLLLAVGNGARSVFRLLAARGVALEAKPFAVGFRLEQDQALIDRDQYGAGAGHPLLGAADYNLTYTDRRSGRGFYTFCNCPGGYVVNASSELDGVVTNGVSLAARDGKRSNAAVVAQVTPGRDFGSDPLDGLLFQEQLEHQAYLLAGGDRALPMMSAAAFCGLADDAEPAPGAVCTARVRIADIRELFSEEMNAGFADALRHWQGQLPGFLSDGLLYGVESRTSCPLRMPRGADRQSVNCRGLYPVGEGSGYAGGIVSSAIDGLRSAFAVIDAMRTDF